MMPAMQRLVEVAAGEMGGEVEISGNDRREASYVSWEIRGEGRTIDLRERMY